MLCEEEESGFPHKETRPVLFSRFYNRSRKASGHKDSSEVPDEEQVSAHFQVLGSSQWRAL